MQLLSRFDVLIVSVGVIRGVYLLQAGKQPLRPCGWLERIASTQLFGCRLAKDNLPEETVLEGNQRPHHTNLCKTIVILLNK